VADFRGRGGWERVRTLSSAPTAHASFDVAQSARCLDVRGEQCDNLPVLRMSI
jgi:hypothetical protein